MGTLLQPLSGSITGPLLRDVNVRLQIEAPNEILRFGIIFATYARSNSNTLVVEINGARQTIPARSIPDNEWVEFDVLGPTRDLDVRISSPDADDANHITIRQSDRKIFPFVRSFINGVETPYDLAVRIVTRDGPTYSLERDFIRAAFGRDLLRGKGFEIGPGATPQLLARDVACRYYDKRSDEELKQLFERFHSSDENAYIVPTTSVANLGRDFPGGADFLIAHNVLEHAPDPVGELAGWQRHVRAGGIVLLSLPHRQPGLDNGRPLPSFAHLVADALDNANGTTFECREHVSSFLIACANMFAEQRGLRSVSEFESAAKPFLLADENDIHWHAYEARTAIHVCLLAALLLGHRIAFRRIWAPEEGLTRTDGDILVAYEVVGAHGDTGLTQRVQRLRDAHAAFRAEVASLAQEQQAAVDAALRAMAGEGTAIRGASQ